MQQNPLVIACGADENYAQSLAVTLYSALRNLETDGYAVDLYIFDGGICAESKERMRRVVEGAYNGSIRLMWANPDMDALADLPTREGISTSAYFRLLIPEHVPRDTERVIYLDSDLLVKADLTQLWKKPMDGQALMAVRGFNNPYVSSRLAIRKYEELGLAPDTPYFNSGVMVINVNWWRREKVPERVCQYMRAYREHLNLCDQEGLNAVLAESWKELDPRWNVIGTLGDLEDWPSSEHKERMRRIREKIMSDPYIYHFAGPSKPWMVEYRHPAQFQWMRCLRESGWYRPAEGIWQLGMWYGRYVWRRITGAIEARISD